MNKALVLWILFFATVFSAPIVGGKEVNIDLLNSTTDLPTEVDDSPFSSSNIAFAGSGAIIGGVFGSFVAPGLGTAVGATIGSFIAPLISYSISLIIT
ncbi:unnamed protein product [Diamesa hyperborea]